MQLSERAIITRESQSINGDLASAFDQFAARGQADSGRGTVNLLSMQLIVVIYFQKLSFPFSPIWVPMVFCFVMLAPALRRGLLWINPARLTLYVLFLIFALASQLFVYEWAWTSMALVFVINSLLIFEWRLNTSEYAQLCRNYSAAMILPCLFVFAQYAYEITHGVGNSLSLDPFLPKAFLTQGFIAESSTEGWVTWNRPNGLIFVEPSFCSAFLAAAAILETYVTRRYYLALFFLAGVITTNGGTGQLMLAIALVVIGGLHRPLTSAILAVAGAVALVSVSTISTADLPLVGRMSELGQADSSGYGRLLAPLSGLIDLASQPRFFFTGMGAGQITSTFGSAWPLTKLVFEYGLATGAAYFLLVLKWFNWRANPPIAAALFVVFQFTGGYLVNPFLILLIHCFCAGEVAGPGVLGATNEDAVSVR